jgi:HTH-type transcriptional regulator, sugar sensing transcriptional regulator
MTEIVELLQALGFGDYEGRAYVALVQRSPLNGYELAKASGLPRANVYSVLDRLEERGAVVRIDTPSGTRYSAVPPAELATHIGSKFSANLSAARRILEEIAAPPAYEYVWNAHGYQSLLDHARTLIDGAQERLLVATWAPEAQALAGNLAKAEARGVEVVTLCLQGCPAECGGCCGAIFRYRLAPEYAGRWLVLVQDESEALAGEIGSGDEALTVRTRQRLLVELSAWYIRHSIALAGVVSDLGDRLPGLLSPQTLAALATLGPGGYRHGEQGEDDGGDIAGWLGYMQQAINRR